MNLLSLLLLETLQEDWETYRALRCAHRHSLRCSQCFFRCAERCRESSKGGGVIPELFLLIRAQTTEISIVSKRILPAEHQTDLHRPKSVFASRGSFANVRKLLKFTWLSFSSREPQSPYSPNSYPSFRFDLLHAVVSSLTLILARSQADPSRARAKRSCQCHAYYFASVLGATIFKIPVLMI